MKDLYERTFEVYDIDLIITPGASLPDEISRIVDLLVEEFELLWNSMLR